MNRKQKIMTLLQVENDWLTANQLAQLLQVSTRTIRSDIKQLRECEESIITSKKYGYKLAPTHRNEQFTADQTYDRKQRLLALWSQFYFAKAVDIYTFAETFYVSESTVINDIAVFKIKFGQFYQGDYHIQRDGAVFSLLAELTPAQFYQFALKKLQIERLEEFVPLFAELDLQAVYRCCVEVLYQSAFNYNALSLIELAVEVAVIITQSWQVPNQQSCECQACQAVVIALKAKLAHELAIDLTKQHVAIITKKLVGIAQMAEYEHELRQTGQLDTELVTKILAAFERFYVPLATYTQQNPSVLHQFCCHLQLARERQRRGFYTLNPLLGQLRSEHKLLFEIAKRALREIGLEFDENECSYIVTYLQVMLADWINVQATQLAVTLIVTNSYSNGLFIERTIRQYFNHADTCTLMREIPKQLPSSDVIFSTHNLARKYPQVIMLTKQFDVADQLKVKAVLKQQRQQQCRHYFQQLVTDFQIVARFEALNQRPLNDDIDTPATSQFQQAVLYQYCREYLQAEGRLGQQFGEKTGYEQICTYYLI